MSIPPQARERRPPIDLAWLVLSSERTTAVVVTLLAAFVGLAGIVPQGREALDLAEHADARAIHRLAAWGLTDIFASSWILAIGSILVANILATLYRASQERRASADFGVAPTGAPFKAELSASLPERAVETLRSSFRVRFGSPARERVEGSRVTMEFDTSPRARIAPLLTHVGLVLLVVGAGIGARPVPEDRSVVRALFEVKDSATGTRGIFDMVSGEAFRFFRWPSEYTIRGYVASKGGLGPAIRLERVLREDRRSEDFWVFLHAPPDFDERHRRGEVSIRALGMRLVPMPGAGLGSSPASVLLVLGLGLLLAAILSGRGPEGRLWIVADGDTVVLTGLPRRKGDERFRARFDGWVRLASADLAES